MGPREVHICTVPKEIDKVFNIHERHQYEYVGQIWVHA